MGEIEFPLDGQGFLRRECPLCEREFKWHHGPTKGAPLDESEPVEYFCPYCGENAPLDQWWTKEQVEAIQATALQEAMPQLEEELRDALGPLNRTGFIHSEVHSDPLNPPPPMFESDDMVAVASPCHSHEPIKVEETWSGPLHCLVCGAAFTV
jgi:hypothetical protein